MAPTDTALEHLFELLPTLGAVELVSGPPTADPRTNTIHLPDDRDPHTTAVLLAYLLMLLSYDPPEATEETVRLMASAMPADRVHAIITSERPDAVG